MPVAGYIIARMRGGRLQLRKLHATDHSPGASLGPIALCRVTYALPLRNDAVCVEHGVVYFEHKFEGCCEVPTRFVPDDAQKRTLRVFVLNDSQTHAEYCIVSNCDGSHGKLCQVELAQTPQLQTGTASKNGAPSTIRTCDLCLRRAALYPAELWVLLLCADTSESLGPTQMPGCLGGLKWQVRSV